MPPPPLLRLLVIDDDAGMRDSLLLSLENAGYTAEGVSDGEAALARLRRLPVPSLVLLDMFLPHVNGWELLAEMRRTPRLQRIPVICVSSDGTRLAETQGADALLPKPFGLHALLELVERFTRQP